MVLENKLHFTDSVELAKVEEKIRRNYNKSLTGVR